MNPPSALTFEGLVRAPWPDELPRLAAAFPQLPWHQPMHLRVVVTAGPIGRLVGYAALIVSDRSVNHALLLLEVRPRFLDAATGRLLAEMIATARSLGVVTLEAPPPGKPPHPASAALAAAGFRATGAEAVFCYDLN